MGAFRIVEDMVTELMGAQKYAKISHKTENSDEKATYKNMARQELDHAKMIIQMGDRDFMGANTMDSLNMVWKSLREHLLDWHGDIAKKLD
jgi:hypothetical protein